MHVMGAMIRLVTSNDTEKVRARDFITEKSQSPGAQSTSGTASQRRSRWTLFGTDFWEDTAPLLGWAKGSLGWKAMRAGGSKALPVTCAGAPYMTST